MKPPDPIPRAAAGLLRATVRGGSMRPWLPDGTDLLVRPAAEGAACRAGDVVVLRLGEAWAVHRALRSVPARGGGSGLSAALEDGSRDGGPTPPTPGDRSRPRARRPVRVPPTRGDWAGVTDGPAGAVVGRVVFARIGGRWRRADSRLARLAGLATGAIAAVVTRLGARGLAADLRRKPRRGRYRA